MNEDERIGQSGNRFTAEDAKSAKKQNPSPLKHRGTEETEEKEKFKPIWPQRNADKRGSYKAEIASPQRTQRARGRSANQKDESAPIDLHRFADCFENEASGKTIFRCSAAPMLLRYVQD